MNEVKPGKGKGGIQIETSFLYEHRGAFKTQKFHEGLLDCSAIGAVAYGHPNDHAVQSIKLFWNEAALYTRSGGL